MKVAILSLALLSCACQSTDTVATASLQPATPGNATSEVAPFSEPAAQEEAVTKTLPRRIHLDRSEHAVRAWVRDRS